MIRIRVLLHIMQIQINNSSFNFAELATQLTNQIKVQEIKLERLFHMDATICLTLEVKYPAPDAITALYHVSID